MTKMPVKKFITRGEEFLDFLKSLGYQPPKHQKGEHYEYLFQDEELSRKVKDMMRRIKPHNIMDTEELHRFQLLKDDGMVLYGKDLEEAVEREKSKDRKIEEDISVANAKEAEWNVLIERKKSNIETLSALNDILNKTVEEQKNQDAQKEQQIAKWESENAILNKAILIDRKMLMEKVDELRHTLEDIITPTGFSKSSIDEETPSSSLIDLDWVKIIEDEDLLMNMIKPMLEKYGTDLIRKASEQDGDDILESDGIQKIFLQYAKDFERLKHSIIYEKVKEAGHNEIMLAGGSGACEKIDDCLQQVERLSQINDADVLKKMKDEVHQDNDQLEESLQVEKDRALTHVTNLAINELNDDIKELMDLKTHAKRNLQEFLEFVVEILSQQKVRVDIIRELSRTEGRDMEKLAQQLNDQKERLNNLQRRQELISEGITEEKLSPDGHHLFEVLSKFDVPIAVLESHTNTMVSLSAIRNQVRLEKCNTLKAKDENLRSVSQKMVLKQAVIRDLYEKVLTQHIESEEEKLIQELEKTHTELQNKLDWHSEHKADIVQENINKKWAAMKKIQMALSKIENPNPIP